MVQFFKNSKSMKKQFLNIFAIALFGLALIACEDKKADNSANDTTKVEINTNGDKSDARKVVKAYLELKDALVSSDVNQAKISAKKLSGKALGEIRTAAESLYATDDLKEQRTLFNTISVQLYNKIKADGGAPITLYKQFCPMAFDNTGAFWLSEDETVKNPYFGDEMMNCGEVQETLAVN